MRAQRNLITFTLSYRCIFKRYDRTCFQMQQSDWSDHAKNPPNRNNLKNDGVKSENMLTHNINASGALRPLSLA